MALAEWQSFLNRLVEKSKTTFNTSMVLEDEKGTAFPTVWALALLARTISNIEAAQLLINNGHLIEARTLVRCCWENFFCMAAIAKTGEEFLKNPARSICKEGAASSGIRSNRTKGGDRRCGCHQACPPTLRFGYIKEMRSINFV